MRKITAYFYIIVGIGIICLWLMLGFTNQIPEFETEPISIIFHIFIEVSMAIMCIVTGILLIKNHSLGRNFLFISSGMLIYSVINSSGYYGDLGQYLMIVFFGIILIITLFFNIFEIRKSSRRKTE